MKIVHLNEFPKEKVKKLTAREERHMRCVAMIAKQRVIDKKKAIEKYRLLELQGKYPFDTVTN